MLQPVHRGSEIHARFANREVEAAKYHHPNGPLPIQVNVRGSFISDESTSCIVAESIYWHTSERIRVDAERIISKLVSSANLTGRWPSKNEIALPVNSETVRVKRIEGSTM
ncbi:hypothetical protein JZU51_00650 [bacterium]|nr:hypothetical protein [bacterium]